MAQSVAPVALIWVDLETDRLIPEFQDQVLDLRPLNILEVGVIITDFDLRPMVGYREAIKLTQAAADGLRANDFIREMHQGSGLIKACIESTVTLEQAEEEILGIIQTETSFSPGELQIAGSGVARFDQTIIQAKMPKLARFIHYAPYDVGVLRRTSKTMAGGDVVNIPKSYKEGAKIHRAYEDVEAHLEEGQRFREFYQRAVALGAHIAPTPEEEPTDG